MEEPEAHTSQVDHADIDPVHHDQQEGQNLQLDLMHHHRLLEKQYEDLMHHHALVQELYSKLMAHPLWFQGDNQVWREYHQALQDHYQMLRQSKEEI